MSGASPEARRTGTLRARTLNGADSLILRLASIPALAALILVTACAREDLRTYEAPKDPVVASAPPVARGPEVPSWTLPAGWEEVAGSGMRWATILAGPPEDRLEIRVTPLGQAARDPLGNVNRWREQIGLGPIGEAELPQFVRTIRVDGRERHLVDVSGPAQGDLPPQRVLGAIVPGEERVWFFLLMDEADRVAPHKEAFDELVLGTRLVRDGMLAAAPPASSPPHPGSAEDMAWKAPTGWELQAEAAGSMRLATFRAPDSPGVEVTITRFPGSVGGLLANVNRWRGQLGLSPVGDLSAQELQNVAVAGEPARLLDLAAAGNNPQRMRVLIVERPSLTWFVKMTGPEEEVENEGARFDTFARSIEFRETSGG